jgi:uncharacterized small protein (DUF1192 family)
VQLLKETAPEASCPRIVERSLSSVLIFCLKIEPKAYTQIQVGMSISVGSRGALKETIMITFPWRSRRLGSNRAGLPWILVTMAALILGAFQLLKQEAATQPPAAIAEEVQELRELIRELQAKVARLEAGQQQKQPTAGPSEGASKAPTMAVPEELVKNSPQAMPAVQNQLSPAVVEVDTFAAPPSEQAATLEGNQDFASPVQALREPAAL